MKIILSPGFPEPVWKALKALHFDVLRTEDAKLSRLLQLSGSEKRILFIQAELLPDHLDVENAYGIIALGLNARTPAGFEKTVLPHLRETRQNQFMRHVTFFSARGDNEVTHVRFEKHLVREKISIPRGTNEQFLHFANHRFREKQSSIILGGYTRTLKGYAVERSPAIFHFFGAVKKGALEVEVEHGEVVTLEAGSMFIISSGAHCTYRAPCPTDFLWFHIEPHAFGHGRTIGKFKYSRVGYPDDLIYYCQQFRIEARNQHEKQDSAMLHLANLIEIFVRRKIAALGMHVQVDESHERLEAALRTLEDNLATSCSVDDLARFSGVSSAHLNRDTQRYFNRSPRELIEGIRIRHARELLLHSNYPIKKIAEMTGYSDAFVFSRAFKRITGSPPSQFRKGRK